MCLSKTSIQGLVLALINAVLDLNETNVTRAFPTNTSKCVLLPVDLVAGW